MNCTNCKTDQPNGKVIDGKFHCNLCILNGMVKKVAHKEIKDSSIIAALKHYGIPGNRAYVYYKNHSLTYLIRKIWQFRHHKESGKKIKSDIAWLQTLIEHNKYPEPDHFLEWVKLKKVKYEDKDFEVLYK